MWIYLISNISYKYSVQFIFGLNARKFTIREFLYFPNSSMCLINVGLFRLRFRGDFPHDGQGQIAAGDRIGFERWAEFALRKKTF